MSYFFLTSPNIKSKVAMFIRNSPIYKKFSPIGSMAARFIKTLSYLHPVSVRELHEIPSKFHRNKVC